MLLLFAATMEIVGLVCAVLFALGVPLFFGLMAWDLIDQRLRHAASNPPVFAPDDEGGHRRHAGDLKPRHRDHGEPGRHPGDQDGEPRGL